MSDTQIEVTQIKDISTDINNSLELKKKQKTRTIFYGLAAISVIIFITIYILTAVNSQNKVVDELEEDGLIESLNNRFYYTLVDRGLLVPEKKNKAYIYNTIYNISDRNAVILSLVGLSSNNTFIRISNGVDIITRARIESPFVLLSPSETITNEVRRVFPRIQLVRIPSNNVGVPLTITMANRDGGSIISNVIERTDSTFPSYNNDDGFSSFATMNRLQPYNGPVNNSTVPIIAHELDDNRIILIIRDNCQDISMFSDRVLMLVDDVVNVSNYNCNSKVELFKFIELC